METSQRGQCGAGRCVRPGKRSASREQVDSRQVGPAVVVIQRNVPPLWMKDLIEEDLEIWTALVACRQRPCERFLSTERLDRAVGLLSDPQAGEQLAADRRAPVIVADAHAGHVESERREEGIL